MQDLAATICRNQRISPLSAIQILLQMHPQRVAYTQNIEFIHDPKHPHTLFLPVTHFPAPSHFLNHTNRVKLANAFVTFDNLKIYTIGASILYDDKFLDKVHTDNRLVYAELHKLIRTILHVDIYTTAALNVGRADLQSIIAHGNAVLTRFLGDIDLVGTLLAQAAGILHTPVTSSTTTYASANNLMSTDAALDHLKHSAKQTVVYDLHPVIYNTDKKIDNQPWKIDTISNFCDILFSLINHAEIVYTTEIHTPRLSLQKKNSLALFIDNQVNMYMLPSERILLVYLIIITTKYSCVFMDSTDTHDDLYAELPLPLQSMATKLRAYISHSNTIK